MGWRAALGCLLTWLALVGSATAGPDATERLDRFRQLTQSRLGALELSGHDPAPEALREIYALLDDEILDNLGSGSFFASEGFLQAQLDAFHEAWGGAAFRILALREQGFTVGAFKLSRSGSGNSVRVYARDDGGARLVKTIARPGEPVLERMPLTRAGEPQFLVAWVGPQSSRGSTRLRIELWRRHEGSVTLVWSTRDLVEDGLLASDYSVNASAIAFRYEVRYPGWKPGCDGQTEHEHLYRYALDRETFVLDRRRVHNGWHREFHATLARFLSALNGDDRGALAEFVAKRARPPALPARLEATVACDAADASPPTAVSVAVLAPEDGRPWTLLFRRTSRGWRLAEAHPLEPISATMRK